MGGTRAEALRKRQGPEAGSDTTNRRRDTAGIAVPEDVGGGRGQG